ncbi:MAG: M48 family metallopeptidase [Cyanobacteriota bacterium]|nr:M48 family metallopeptidase [Cyanobacteriota bacterium]
MTQENYSYSDRNPPPNNRQLLILLGAAIALIIGIIWALGLAINGIIGLIPPQVELKLGSFIVPVFEEQAKPSPAQDRLNQLLDRLEQHLPQEQQERDYGVLYVPQDTVNAIAIPGDVVIIYKGLLEQMESENELMMVLGHELGHFAHRDHLRRLGRSVLLRFAIAYFVGDAGALQGILANSALKVGESRFSQSQEMAADEFGLTLLNATYNRVAGATDFFARLAKERGQNWAILSTHPAPKRRVRKLNRLISQRNYPIGEKVPLPSVLQSDL